MKVLVIAPHLDDEVLGCGGTILRHKADGHDVNVVFVANRVYGHVLNAESYEIERSHAQKAREILGYDEAVFLDLPDERLDVSVQDIIVPLEQAYERFASDIVYVPFYGDNNQDHRAVFDAVRVVVRPAANPRLKAFYLYETSSCTEQSPAMPGSTFIPNKYVDIDEFLQRKIDALSCYETESRHYPHPRSPEAVRVLAGKRGIEAGRKHCEAFMVAREIW